MRKVVLKYGLLAGLIVVTLIVLMGTFTNAYQADSYASMVAGYASMIIALSMIYFAIRSYRDDQLNGTITFGRGFLVGLYVTLIASTLYAIGWKIYYSIAMPDFWDHYAKHSIESLRQHGGTDAQILAKTREVEGYKEMFKNPLIEFAMTFVEIFPVGLLVSAVCAGFLRRKPEVRPLETATVN